MFCMSIFTVLTVADGYWLGSCYPSRPRDPGQGKNGLLSNFWFTNSLTDLLFLSFSMLWSKISLWLIPDHRDECFLQREVLTTSSVFLVHKLFIGQGTDPTSHPGAKQENNQRLTFSENITGKDSADIISSISLPKATVKKTFIKPGFGLHSRNPLGPGWSCTGQRIHG